MSECYYCDGRGHVPTSGGDLDVECPVCYGDGMAIPDPDTTTRAERQVAAVRETVADLRRAGLLSAHALKHIYRALEVE